MTLLDVELVDPETLDCSCQKTQQMVEVGVESNQNSFEIRSIRFENLQFDDSKEQKLFEKFDEN